ncbi:hypothetical protein B0H16DRAFT_1793306 [Mycena metata]|uniref:Uncharacterized protein n=1 Tax=Mycena metata TaxID=1033252 RepID=A0AAD7JK61_9AGAR|nr:hypothetical protein B0H16DRAFT_1793306 [Mycena metata]
MSISTSTSSSASSPVSTSGFSSSTASAPSTSSSASHTFSMSVVERPDTERSTSSLTPSTISPTFSSKHRPSSVHSFSTSSTSLPGTTSSYLPATPFTIAVPSDAPSSTPSSAISSTAVAPQAVNDSVSPGSHRARIIAGATVSAVAFLGLIILAALYRHRRFNPKGILGFHGNHSRRAFTVHPRAEDEDDDAWKHSTVSDGDDDEALPKLPHYIPHSRTASADYRGSLSSQIALWAEMRVVEPLPLSRPTSPPATSNDRANLNRGALSPDTSNSSIQLLRMKSTVSSIGSNYSSESLGRAGSRDDQLFVRLPQIILQRLYWDRRE